MERKKILFKNIFYIIFALMFLGVGFLFFQKPKDTSALDVSAVEPLGEQTLRSRPYFLRDDFVMVEDESSNLDEKPLVEKTYTNSLIDSDTFFYSDIDHNSLRLAFNYNGGEGGTYQNQDIFNYVYYPDLNDRSTFMFFTNISPNFYINGKRIDISEKESKYIKPLDHSFGGKPEIQTFEMVFDADGEGEHSYSLFDQKNFVEGVYQLSLSYTIFSTTNGTDALDRITFTPEKGVTETYTFFVTNRSDYLTNNRPNMQNGSFDNVIQVENTLQSDAFMLYSNYSSKAISESGATSSSTTDADKIPYIQYDYQRFEADISKELSNSFSNVSLKLNMDSFKNADESPVVFADASSDEDIVQIKLDKETHQAKVFFTDLGVYNIALKPILVVNFGEDNAKTWQKYNLDGVANVTKTSKVHMYGYQLFHTDFDHPANENNVRPVKEMKNIDKENETFINSADVTSQFLHSNETNFWQTGSNSSTTFTPRNIFNFINKQKEVDGEKVTDENGNPVYALTPVKTNQTPLRFLANASLLSDVRSTIYTTAKIDTFTEVSTASVQGGLQGEKLYEGTFDGLAENTPGKYVYVLRYTYNNFNLTESTPGTSQIFTQIFFFEIDRALQDIQIVAESGTKVSKDMFLNQSVTITDTTKADKFNKDVTVQIYAWDYAAGTNGQWMNGYTSAGNSMLTLLEGDTTDYELTLTDNARYTIRLYYTNEITTAKLDYDNGYGYFRQLTFTIDTNPISGIKARNFQQITGSSRYFKHSDLADDGFSSNQPIAFSWDKKKSDASTRAYYRYFPLQSGVLGQYYSTDKSKVSQLLTYMVSSDVLPVNNVLDLRASASKTDGTDETRNWLPYAGNTLELDENNLDKQYVFSDAGLYLLDVYDSAGNHKLDVFMIDDTSPIFAIQDDSGYSIPTSPFINEPSILHWGKFKGIYIAGLSSNLFTDQTYETVYPESEDLTDEFYKTYDGKTCPDIYALIRKKLFDNNRMKYLSPSIAADSSTDKTSTLISNYDGLYVTIEIENVSYYMESSNYQSQPNVFKKEFKAPLTETTYTVLIRDKSNTKKYNQWGDYAEQQYTSFYSARQTIIISFDTSRFFIEYDTNQTDEQGLPKADYLTSNNFELSDEGETITTYLNPTRMNKPLYITFRPSDPENDIQVDTVTVQYYEFKEMSRLVPSPEDKPDTDDEKVERTKYWYYAFTDTPSEPQPIYSYNSDSTKDTSTWRVAIKTTDMGITEPGKYVIKRTYKTGEGFSKHNEGDYTTRTYILIVDRNDVISNQDLVTDANGKNHSEDLVGGDIFVAMYDSGVNSNLVVTFPNSESGNTNGQMLYSNNLTTNELPVKLYIPQFKYTTYAEKVKTSSGYEFKVNYDFDSETSVDIEGESSKIDLDTMNYYNFKEGNLIREYALYAEIYKDANPNLSSVDPLAVTSDVPKTPTLDSVKASQGFLKFYDYSTGAELKMLYQPGTYYVRIYQGLFGTGIDENLYTKTFDFSFVIESTTPNFDVTATNGQSLNSDVSASSNPIVTYYTNQSKLNITWNKSRNEFLADIDDTQIKFVTSQETFTYNRETDTYSKNHTDIWDSKPEANNYVFSGILNLRSLPGVYQNGGYVEITMQYKNHDVAKNENGGPLYSTITKRINVDISAPSTNVETLVDRALENAPASMSSVFNHDALRIYRTADNDAITTSLDNASYNVSNGNDQNIFAYYSYSVTKDFLNNLKSIEGGNATAYLRKFKVGDINTKYTAESKETGPSEFNANDFALASTTTSLDANTYYEVVEMDKARNMAIYTIYVADLESEQNMLTYVDENGKEKVYTTTDYARVQSHPNAINNIFARTGFELRSINFFGDEWARLRLTTYSRNENGNVESTTTNLMLTPYDSNNAYVFGNNGTTQKVAISKLIDGSQSLVQKHRLEIFNRLDPNNSSVFYFNIFNTPLTPMPTMTSTRELLGFANVSDEKIENTEMAQDAFVVGMKITVDNIAIYSDGVDENGVAKQVQNPLGYASLWKNFTQNSLSEWRSDEFVRVYVTGGELCFEVNPNYSSAARNSRVVYEFTDNYGITYTETHIFRETVISQEVSSENENENPLYAYYDNSSVKLNYIIKDGLRYNYNANKYHVECYEIVTDDQDTERVAPTHLSQDEPSFSGGITTLTFHSANHPQNEQYHDNFVLVLYDQLEYETNNHRIEGINAKKEIYFSFYDQLPRENLDGTQSNDQGQFQLRDVNGNVIASSTLVNGSQGYYSQVQVLYNPLDDNKAFIPVKYMYRTEDTDWKELTSGTRLQNTTDGLETYYLKIWYDEHYLHNELGNGAYVFERVPESQIFQFSLSSLTSNYWVEATINGVTTVVKKAEQSFKSPDKDYQTSNHYIVNAPKENVHIKVNNEQDIRGYDKPTRTWQYSGNNNQQIESELYNLTNKNSHLNIPVFETSIVITYIPNEENFLTSFFTLDINGTVNTNENLVSNLDTAEKMLVVPKDLDMDRTQLIWSKYFVIPENEIEIHIKLADKELDPVVYTKTVENEECKYIYLTYSGLYTIQFTDTAGNVQKFANKDANGNVISETDTFEFIFLKDAPFTVTYTNPETGEIETALPVKQAVYNDYVTLNIDKATLSRFYRSDGYPSFLDTGDDPENPEERKYLVKRNGVTYNKEFDSTTEFTFDEPGYYEIAFASVSNLPTVGSIRQETYQFTIINQNEYKVSHVFNKYSNYYIEKVQKRVAYSYVDITEELVNSLNVDTIIVGGKVRMTQLPLSYMDEKTGVGEYLITVNTNNRLYNSEDITSRFTYKVTINSGTAPLRISLKEGKSTTGRITINYNLSNLFYEMGESNLRIVRLTDDNGYVVTSSVAINETSTGESSLQITTSGTYFIQILSPSGNLLFTYKVVRNEPLNTAAIIAIIVGAVVLVAVIIIIIKLRKRISVK